MSSARTLALVASVRQPLARTVLLLAFVLAVLQSAALWHEAHHGFRPHQHHGHTCEVGTYCDKLTLNDIGNFTPPTLLAILPEPPVITLPVLLQMVRVPASLFPRAPPAAR